MRRNIKFLAISLILISSLVVSVSCSLIPTPRTETPPPSPPTTENTTSTETEWSITPGQSQAPILPNVADVVAKVKPSVVAINTKVIGYDFFNRPSVQEGAASGWIIREDGIIVTNNHVVEGAESMTVTLADSRTFPVDLKTVATDPLTDLAILKIEAKSLPVVTVGDSSGLRVGDWVVAIGNSLGRGTRATVGIVSQLGVSLQVDQGQTLYGLIDTSAAINPGNSGGPLVNMAGEVIGITSAKIATIGVEATGYAISINEAIPIIEQLMNPGYVVRSWLGVGLYTVDQFVVFRYDLAVEKGALVTNVAPSSPADKAGLKAGDVITKFEEQEITEANELIRAIHSSKVGQKVKITFWREKTEKITDATLAESPPPA